MGASGLGRNRRNRARGGKEFTGPRKGAVPGNLPCVWSQREPSEPIPNPALRGPKPGPHCTMAAGTLCRPAGQQPRQARRRAGGQEEGSTQAIPILPAAGLACMGQPRKSSGRGHNDWGTGSVSAVCACFPSLQHRLSRGQFGHGSKAFKSQQF